MIRIGLSALAAAVLAGAILAVLGTDAGPPSAAGRAAAVGLLVVQVGSLGWMLARPERSMVVALVAGLGLGVLCPRFGALGLAGISICAFAAVRPPRVTLWALGFMVALAPWAAVENGALAGLIAAGGPVLSWSWGELIRSGRDRRRAEAQRALAQERGRIARELHDVVAHNVSLIVIQAVAAQDVFDVVGELQAGGGSVELTLEPSIHQVGDQIEIDAATTVDQRLLGMTASPLRMIRVPARLTVHARLRRCS